jgi:hypothetical protein
MPETQNGAAVQVRLHGPLFERLENWRRAQPSIPHRSEALRALLEQALAPRDGTPSAAKPGVPNSKKMPGRSRVN